MNHSQSHSGGFSELTEPDKWWEIPIGALLIIVAIIFAFCTATKEFSSLAALVFTSIIAVSITFGSILLTGTEISLSGNRDHLYFQQKCCGINFSDWIVPLDSIKLIRIYRDVGRLCGKVCVNNPGPARLSVKIEFVRNDDSIVDANDSLMEDGLMSMYEQKLFEHIPKEEIILDGERCNGCELGVGREQ